MATGIVIDEITMYVLILTPVIIGVCFFTYWLFINRFAPEGKIFAKARWKRIPVLFIHDTAGTVDIVLGCKQKRDDIAFNTKRYGIQLDPGFESSAPEDRTLDGLRMYHYSVSFPFPIGGRNARAIERIIDFVREGHKDLSFLSDLEVLTLLGTARDDLKHDCQIMVDKYQPSTKLVASVGGDGGVDGAATDALVTCIEHIQDEVSTIPIESNDFFSYTYAFKLIPSAMLSQDIHQLKLLIERKLREEITREWDKFLYIGICALLIMVGGAVAKMIL